MCFLGADLVLSFPISFQKAPSSVLWRASPFPIQYGPCVLTYITWMCMCCIRYWPVAIQLPLGSVPNIIGNWREYCFTQPEYHSQPFTILKEMRDFLPVCHWEIEVWNAWTWYEHDWFKALSPGSGEIANRFLDFYTMRLFGQFWDGVCHCVVVRSAPRDVRSWNRCTIGIVVRLMRCGG